jgi:hypothetical protein
VEARARQLGIAQDAYLAILLGNHIAAGKAGLAHVGERKPLRPPATLRMTLPEHLHASGIKIAERWGLTFGGLMQSLIVRDAWHEDDDLNIVPIRPNKPHITGVK